MRDISQKAGSLLARIRQTRPVVHSITNFVVMNSTANVLLAMGASPIMAHALEDAGKKLTDLILKPWWTPLVKAQPFCYKSPILNV